MNQINFAQIGHVGEAPSESFEGLVCQLARNTSDSPHDTFIKNNGSGGDGGVECYLTLANGDEYGWQAKYFLETLQESQWTQITASVRTAIDKHPKLTKYYICLPRNLNDSRKRNSGKPVNTERDRWNKHVRQ